MKQGQGYQRSPSPLFTCFNVLFYSSIFRSSDNVLMLHWWVLIYLVFTRLGEWRAFLAASICLSGPSMILSKVLYLGSSRDHSEDESTLLDITNYYLHTCLSSLSSWFSLLLFKTVKYCRSESVICKLDCVDNRVFWWWLTVLTF